MMKRRTATLEDRMQHLETLIQAIPANIFNPALLDEVRGLTIDDLPPHADPFLEPHDEPLPGRSHVYVVWRGRVPGLYYRW